MRTLIATLTALMLFAATPLVAGDFEDGIVASWAGDHQKAFRLIEPLAEQGHAPAQAHLGLAFLTVGVDTVTTFAFQNVVARLAANLIGLPSVPALDG